MCCRARPSCRTRRHVSAGTHNCRPRRAFWQAVCPRDAHHRRRRPRLPGRWHDRSRIAGGFSSTIARRHPGLPDVCGGTRAPHVEHSCGVGRHAAAVRRAIVQPSTSPFRRHLSRFVAHRSSRLLGGSDNAVRQGAVEHGCLLVSKDEDFHRLSMLHGAPPKVVWLRLGNCTTQLIVDLLRAQVEDIQRSRSRTKWLSWNSEAIRRIDPNEPASASSMTGMQVDAFHLLLVDSSWSAAT